MFAKQNGYEQISKAVFSILRKKSYPVYDKLAIYLSRIELLNKMYTQRGIAKNMLKIIELFANNNNKKEICCFIVPYSFGTADVAGVYTFYKKMGFIDKSKLDDNTDYHAYKYLETKNNAELKLSIINYPTTKTQYTIVLPSHLIFDSYYKGVEKELQ